MVLQVNPCENAMKRKICYLIPVFYVFLLLVRFHDDGIPATLSTADQVYVLQQSEIAHERMEVVIEQMHLFVAGPDREDELSISLAAAADSLREIGDKIGNDGRFYVNFDDEDYRKKWEQIGKDNDEATAKFTEEIRSRGERGELSDEVRERLLVAFSPKIESTIANSPCRKGKCVWCFWRRMMF